MEKITERLYNWASVLDEGTRQQALKTSRLPVVSGPVALMPDAHLGIGATVGSVIPTKDAVIPAAVGVDIGCGMIAVETDLSATRLPDDLDPLLPMIAKAIPAGLGRWHAEISKKAADWYKRNPPPRPLGDLAVRAGEQFGTLGSGNHFFEICLDERETVWVVLHSGSRGVGNRLATDHIGRAKRLARDLEIRLEDPDLAYFVDGTAEFQEYIADMLWSQDYAKANRDEMMDRALNVFFNYVGVGRQMRRINCHHNFTQWEVHTVGDSEPTGMWITRKGAIKADRGDLGVIPGSMGAASYIVAGLGNPLSYNSCSHGAGRLMSRGEAKRTFTAKDLRAQMAGKVWQKESADTLIDEIPGCYKPIDQVMADQADLVEVVHTLRQLLNYKGTEERRRRRT